MKRTMRAVFWLVCLIFLVSLVWTSQAAQAADRKEIVIGTHMPLSGASSKAGKEQKWAYDLIVKQVNEAGGIFVKEYNKKLPVKLVTMDDETDPAKAAAAVERLIKRNKVDMILGGQDGALGVLPGMTTAEKYKVYYHATQMFPNQFLEKNFQWGTLFFFNPEMVGKMTFEVWQKMPEDQRPKKPAAISEDSFEGKYIGDAWEALGKSYGYTFGTRGSLGLGAKDFTSQILKAKEEGVDAVFCIATAPEIVTFIRQSKENKFNFKYYQSLKGAYSPDFYKALGKDANYVFTDGFWSEDYPYKGAKELGGLWHKQTGTHSVTIGMFYATAQILFAAIEKAGTIDGAKVRQAVLANEFDTVNGKAKYDAKGVALFPPTDAQWWNGKQELIYPLEHAAWQPKPAPPWDKR
jgi:branched-chain amino acid transport system substrate-binding protein